jgi:hypothetical protein
LGLDVATTDVPDLPGLGTTFSALLFVSHAAYLTSKAHDKPN